MIIVLIAFAVVLSLPVFETSIAYGASSSEGLSVDPIFQDLEMENGSEIETNIFITNTTSEPQEVAISAIDIAQESLTGKLLFVEENTSDYPHSLTPYMIFDKDRFVVLPGATESLTVYIEDREAIKPGGHYASVLVKAVDAEESTDTTTVLPTLASVLFIRKTGALNINYQLQNLTGLDNVQTSFPKNIRARFTNDGNSHITPRGTVKISGWNNRVLSQSVLNPDSAVLFPNTQRDIGSTTQLQSRLFPIEILTLEFDYRDNSENSLRTETLRGLYIHPLVIAVVFGSILMLFIRKYKFKKLLKKPKEK